MRLPFAVKLAWRESRSSARRLGVYMSAIALGVAALVAINSFRAAVRDDVRAEARRLLGADLQLRSDRVFPEVVQSVIDSLAAAGAPVSTITATVSVALAPNGATRLVQLRAVEGGFPFYGEYTTEPAGLWPRLAEARTALVEPAVLTALDAAVGDTLRIGNVGFHVAGVLTDLPAEVAFRSAMAPRVYIARRWLDETGLIRFGSMVSHQAYVALPDEGERTAFVARYREPFREVQVRTETAEEQAEDLARATNVLARFLGLIGLAALLLGGLGVASAVGVFVREKRPVIAVLRCIGATQRTAFTAYLLQAALLGFAGAAAGALLGIGLQAAIPPLLSDVLPVPPTFAVRPAPIAAGLATGVTVATLFALIPLLEVRGVSPLQALRQEYGDGDGDGDGDADGDGDGDADGDGDIIRRLVTRTRTRTRPLILAWLLLLAATVILGVMQAGEVGAGVAFAVGIGGALVLLRVSAWLLMKGARRWFPRRAGFVVRQGVAGLYRPLNQTAAVTVALGFGVFVVATLWLVQRSLVDRLEVDEGGEEANLIVFDVQPDQREGVLEILGRYTSEDLELVPIVPARIAAIAGTPVDALLEHADSLGIERWALRHEYRNTYRATLSETEELVAGRWWSADGGEESGRGLPRISIEEDVAADLRVGVGDRVTWDFQGVRIETEIASVRRVDWNRVDTNFFVVFEPGTIDNAPQTYVTLARIDDAGARAGAQRDIAREYANVLSLDIALLRETLARIVERVVTAIRFMAAIGVVAGLIVMAGAITASRFQRVRESALLRTLGATRAQIRRILLTEYLALGTIAALAGGVLAIAAAWGVATFFFEVDFTLPLLPFALGILAVAVAAAALGMTSSREALRGTPLMVLREGA